MSYDHAPEDVASSAQSSVWSQRVKDDDERVPRAFEVHPSNARFIPGVKELMSLERPTHMPRLIDQFLADLETWSSSWTYPLEPRSDSTDNDERYEQMRMTQGLGTRVRMLLDRLNACSDLRKTTVFQSLSKILSLLDSTRSLEDYAGPILMPGAPVVVWYTVVQKCIQFFRTGVKRHLTEADYDVEWYIRTFCAFMLHMWASPTPIDAILYMTLGSYATVICEHTHTGVADLNIWAAKAYCQRHPEAAKQQHETRLIATAIECDRKIGLQTAEDGILQSKEIDILQGQRTSLYNALDALEPDLEFSWSMTRKVISRDELSRDETLTKTVILTEILHATSSEVHVHSLPGEEERKVCHPDIATISEKVMAQQAILVALKQLCREYQEVITAYLPLAAAAEEARAEWRPLIKAFNVKKKALKKMMACLSVLSSIGFSDEEEIDAATKLTEELGDSMASYARTKDPTTSANDYLMDDKKDSRTKSAKLKDEGLPSYNNDDDVEEELPTESRMAPADLSMHTAILELANIVRRDMMIANHKIAKGNMVLNCLDTTMNERLERDAGMNDFPTYEDCKILQARKVEAEASPGRKVVTFGPVEQITGSTLSSVIPTKGHWVHEKTGQLLKPNGNGAVELTWLDMSYPDNDPYSLAHLRERLPSGYSTARIMGPMHGTATPVAGGILRNAFTMRGGTSVASAARWNMPGARKLAIDLTDEATRIAAESMLSRQESLRSVQGQQVDLLIEQAFPPGSRLTATPLDSMHPPPRRADISRLNIPTCQISPLFKAPPPFPQPSPTECNPEKWVDDRLFVWGIEVDNNGWEKRPIVSNPQLVKTFPLVPTDDEDPFHVLWGDYQAWPIPAELSDSVMENILRWELPTCRDPSRGLQDCREWALRVGYPAPPRYLGAPGDPHNVPLDHLVVAGRLQSLENVQNVQWVPRP